MPKRSSPTGSELFIVDNSEADWKVVRYLHEWCQFSKGLDIATGYFEIGALLALDGEWQKVDEIRVLMGNEVSNGTAHAFRQAFTAVEATLDGSLEREKVKNALLKGVPAVVEALKSGKIRCRAYRKDKFHAKAYITHSRLDVVGSAALVGSSNFTYPGLTENIELNVQITGRPVAVLQEWYEEHWEKAEDVTPEILKVIERHVAEYSPFIIYAKALQEFFRGHQLTATEWDESVSRMFPRLDRYQKEAYWALLKIARQHGGAFLCDGVGLGKTFVGLMLIERLILHESKRVVLFAPKGAKEGVWEPHLRDWLPHIGGIGGSADFSNLAVFSHTDLGRGNDFPERFRRVAELADAVIIDEAHHFRNTGRRGDPEAGVEPSRYYRLYDLLDAAKRRKSLYLLTATPINNRLSDFRHLAELFTRRDETYFARTLGVNSLTAHFNMVEKHLRDAVGYDVTDVSEVLEQAQELLTHDQIFRELVVQRSRTYAKESQIQEKGSATSFPVRKPPQVAEYSIKKTYGRLLELFEKSFQKSNPLFTLAMYYPGPWALDPAALGSPLEEGRLQQIVGLIRTNFLKRFESSVVAFELSCHRLLVKLLAFVQRHAEAEGEKKRLTRWKDQNAEILGFAAKRELEFWGEGLEVEEEDIVPEELLQGVEVRSRSEYDVAEMISETFLDLDQIVTFLEEARKFKASHDDKLQKLIRLLKSKDLTDQKVLIFTEFADTARYLRRELAVAGISGVEQVDSATKGNRRDVIERFAPYYNGLTSSQLAAAGRKEIRILISTDVLAEGLNLQDASRMINYDIHWNPVRLMQRIGRVDRRMNPAIEEQLVEDHPEVASLRGKVSFWNFLPPLELNQILSLFHRVTQKTLLISRTLGIEGKQLLTPDDDFEALKDFNHEYEGTKTAVEQLHLEFQALLQDDPGLEARLGALPGSVFSGRKRASKGRRGIFLCYALPALDKEAGVFTTDAGSTRWYLYTLDDTAILEQPAEIVDSIRSEPETPRRCVTEAGMLMDARAKVEKHIKNTYLKRVDAPVGVKPALRCWMELNEG